MKDLTNSSIERQNILNDKYALQQIQDYVGLEGMLFDGEYKYTKAMVWNSGRVFMIGGLSISS